MVLKITEEKDPIKQSTKVPQSVGVNSSNSINKKNSLPLLQSNKQQRNKSCHLPQILPHKMSNHFSFSVFPHNRVLKTSPNFFLRFLGKTIIRVRIVDSPAGTAPPRGRVAPSPAFSAWLGHRKEFWWSHLGSNRIVLVLVALVLVALVLVLLGCSCSTKAARMSF